MMNALKIGFLLFLCVLITACSANNENVPVESEPPTDTSPSSTAPANSESPSSQSASSVPANSESPSSQSASSVPANSESPSSQSASSVPANNETKEASESAQHTPPPRILLFDNYDDIATLNEWLSKSDTDIENNRDELNYMNRGEMKELLTLMNALYLPVLENVPPNGISVYPMSKEVNVFYQLSDGTRYVFRISTEENTAQKEIASTRANYPNIILEEINSSELGIMSGESIEFPKGITVYTRILEANSLSNNNNQETIFDVNAHGNYIWILTNIGDTPTAAKGLQAFDFVKLDFSSASGVKVAG